MLEMNFAPLMRSTVGFDRVMDLMNDALRFERGGENYPPYNIEKTGEDAYRVTLAVAGFTPDELSVVQEGNSLLIAGSKQGEDTGQYLHRGIAARKFQRHFELADFVKVTGASVQNGLLTIELVREIPEAMKPRRIEIATGGGGSAGPKAIESQTQQTEKRAA